MSEITEIQNLADSAYNSNIPNVDIEIKRLVLLVAKWKEKCLYNVDPEISNLQKTAEKRFKTKHWLG